MLSVTAEKHDSDNAEVVAADDEKFMAENIFFFLGMKLSLTVKWIELSSWIID